MVVVVVWRESKRKISHIEFVVNERNMSRKWNRENSLQKKIKQTVDNRFMVKMCVVIKIDFTLHAFSSSVFWFCVQMHRIDIYIV